ncbi:MAG: hypothetical protein B9S32_05155 [Verrucomicrobia bacterium Tous-C9LFEB]|nr:MAG: hypothetical protein B9S32_05155 [Verrucomicrobia bacterium Tous-C9LFEB]
MKLSSSSGIAAIVLWVLQATCPSGIAGVQETFSAVPEDTELKSVENWSVHQGDGHGGKVKLAAGYSGPGARIELNEQYRRLIPEDQAFVLEEKAAGEFRIKLRVMAPNDGYVMTQVLIGSNDGVHGMAIRFNGGTRDGSADNFIQISSGGASWGKISFDDIKKAAWKKETWYEIVISDFSRDPNSPAVEGKVTIREAGEAPDILLEATPIRAFGTSGKFTKINVVVVGNCGTARAFDVDDLSVK